LYYSETKENKVNGNTLYGKVINNGEFEYGGFAVLKLTSVDNRSLQGISFHFVFFCFTIVPL
jgi:hypothetical protein